MISSKSLFWRKINQFGTYMHTGPRLGKVNSKPWSGHQGLAGVVKILYRFFLQKRHFKEKKPGFWALLYLEIIIFFLEFFTIFQFLKDLRMGYFPASRRGSPLADQGRGDTPSSREETTPIYMVKEKKSKNFSIRPWGFFGYIPCAPTPCLDAYVLPLSSFSIVLHKT